MIKLKDIGKYYELNDKKLNVLKKININFRESEFVCILGPSGCGKTTLLNIIGGLDRYTSGDLSINGKSTKSFTDSDWDSYRNHEVGFVFQSYNLIQHQTVLENVETALTISGVKASERKKRAIKALVKVGLEDHLRKKPRQLSGGEMQRAAIARALVNNPTVILADEPTGALDSQNSVQVMDILKDISKNRLVVTVTHNDELANRYATRIIRISDGEIISDSNPYYPEKEVERKEEKPQKGSVMPYSLAMKLSFKNLLGKKVRTILTAVASAISIVGITMVLACSNGLNAYIDKIQNDTMSGTPIQVSETDYDYSGYIETLFGYLPSGSGSSSGGNSGSNSVPKYPTDSILINHVLSRMSTEQITNNITQEYLDYVSRFDPKRVTYNLEYNVSKYVYKSIRKDIKSNGTYIDTYDFDFMVTNTNRWMQIPSSREIVEEQYEIIGKYPTNANELALVIGNDSKLTDAVLASYYIDLFASETDANGEFLKEYYTYDEILSPDTNYGKFNLISADDYFYMDTVRNSDGTEVTGYNANVCTIAEYMQKTRPLSEQVWEDFIKSQFGDFASELKCFTGPKNNYELKIVGIFKMKEDTQYGMFSSSPICYTSALTEKVRADAYNTEVVKEQLASHEESLLISYDSNRKVYYREKDLTEKKYKSVLSSMGWAEIPNKIKFYPKTISDKDYLIERLDAYNEGKSDEDKIKYTDNVGFAIEFVRQVVSSISIILIALTSVSLIVSIIMMSVITYVSVLERTKEIGILRAVGARKKDVMRLFVTETGIIGFTAGILGLIINSFAVMPINGLLYSITKVKGFAFLSWWNVLLVIVISTCLTILAGLVPSLMAGKKDPVKSLRAE